MTMRVLDLIDECHGFDYYILKVSMIIHIFFFVFHVLFYKFLKEIELCSITYL